MKRIDVCLSPDLLHLHKIEDKIVVIADILRATSSITTAIAHGVKCIKPVATLDECRMLKSEGYIIAAERDGQRADGFDIGNSPFSYTDKSLKNKSVAMTTTNGTVAIEKAKSAHKVLIGSFLNISSLVAYIKNQPCAVLVLCAGWKGKVNLEDSLFAGALVERLKEHFVSACDAPLAVQTLYNAVKNDLHGFLRKSSHVKRLNRLHIMKDIEFCLTFDRYEAIPILKEGKLVMMKPEVMKGADHPY